MTAQTLSIVTLPHKHASHQVVRELASAALKDDLIRQGRASFLTSGGSSPKDALNELSTSDIDWSRISVGLVDDRFVPPDHDASNEKLVRENLLQNRASAAQFVPMWQDGDVPIEYAARTASAAYEDLIPPSFTLLGMGLDSHTASWFPGSKTLDGALSPTARSIVEMDASGCPGAGDLAFRLTLSLPAIAKSRQAILLLFGALKREAFVTAMQKPIKEAPIRAAVEALGNRLTVVWAP